MLNAISIRNVVLIDRLDTDFNAGLGVFTGETGAGKSIFLDSLMLALGARSDSSLIRHGQDKLSVNASFTLNKNHPVWAILQDQDIDNNDYELSLRRTVTKDGKSKAFINDTSVSAGLLRQIGDMIVEIHGQFANHTLLDQSTHIEVLDRYGENTSKLDKVKDSFHKWQEVKKEKQLATQLLEQSKSDEEFLRFSVSEIEKLNPAVGEVEELEQKRLILMNTQKLTENLNQATDILHTENPEKIIGNALIALERASIIIPDKFDEVIKMLDSARIEISEATSTLEEVCNSIELDATSLEEIDDRLYAIKEIARKHKVEVEEIHSLLASFKQKLSTLELGEDKIKELEAMEIDAKNNYLGFASSLSSDRKKAGEKLDLAVSNELASLKLEKAKFKTQIDTAEENNWNEKGMDKVAFMVATNSGQPLSPINKTASGGELARFMLALKVNLADATTTSTMVFDEVDTGIGGATATAVGKRLAKLGETKQILVVTHSPQVASFGGSHYKIAKSDTTSCTPLTNDERVSEIARMLSGEKITDEAISAAKALLKDNHDNR